MTSREVDRLIDQSVSIPFSGWDFSALGQRVALVAPPWSLDALVAAIVGPDTTMLDLGTGAGEWLSRLACRPRRTVATESWPPNVPVAAARLRPLGVAVVRDEGAAANAAQWRGVVQRGRLPFADDAFDAVTSRHEAFVGAEVARVLRRGGAFVTQQAHSGSKEFHELLGLTAPPADEFSLALAIEQVTAAGLDVEASGAGTATTVFADVGALSWYLANVPWAVPGFDVEEHRQALRALHGAPIPVRSARFWLRARLAG